MNTKLKQINEQFKKDIEQLGLSYFERSMLGALRSYIDQRFDLLEEQVKNRGKDLKRKLVDGGVDIR